MFDFSSKTVVNKEFKLVDIFRQIKATKEIKEDASNIKTLILSNVINASRINAQENNEFKEIYIFELELASRDIPQLFISELDKSVKFHTFFVFKYNDLVSTSMCFKEIGKTVKLGKYYKHDFNKENTFLHPQYDDVADVYKFLYAYEVGISPRKFETPNEYLSRINLIHKLDFQISKTEQGILYEVQPKKKYKYHERLLKYRQERAQLLKQEETGNGR